MTLNSISSLSFSDEELQLVSKTIAMLSADGVEAANSGHPGMPMGMADIGAVLWLKYLKFNPAQPKWLNRDRFVLSNGHGSMFLYSLLHLSGYDLSLDDLKNFRQWGSRTPGHPESFVTEGVECTTGPLGQGIANAVGMAMAERVMAERYNAGGKEIFDHRVFSFVGDGCLMEGVSGEASSLAGHLGLGNLIVLYDDNHISIAGDTALAFTEDAAARYQAYGWHVERIDGHNFSEIDAAIGRALEVKDKPSFIAARTTIGKGSPNKANSHGVHGAPLGDDELSLTKKNLDWPLEPRFYIPAEVKEIFNKRTDELKAAHSAWSEDFSAWEASNPELGSALENQLQLKVPADLTEKLIAAAGEPSKVATRKLSQAVLQVASAEVNSLIGGSADLEPSTLTLITDSTSISKKSFAGKNIHFGVREHAMGAIMNGFSYYGGFIPYGSTFFCFSDYMRPTIRLAALSGLPGIFIFTHDSVFLGEDGPTHQPVEHLAALRIIPNLNVFRPADGVETAVAYQQALERTDGPSAIICTRQSLEPIERGQSFDVESVKKGAYAAFESKPGSAPDLLFVASGSEVSLAIETAKSLGAIRSVRVVSMLSTEIYQAQPEAYRAELIPTQVPTVVVEAGVSFGWLSVLARDAANTLVYGIENFGASAPASVIAEKLGFTAPQLEKVVSERFPLG